MCVIFMNHILSFKKHVKIFRNTPICDHFRNFQKISCTCRFLKFSKCSYIWTFPEFNFWAKNLKKKKQHYASSSYTEESPMCIWVVSDASESSVCPKTPIVPPVLWGEFVDEFLVSCFSFLPKYMWIIFFPVLFIR